MTASILRLCVKSILFGSLWILCASSHAFGNWEAGKAYYQTYCVGCHADVTLTPPSQGSNVVTLQTKLDSPTGSMRTTSADARAKALDPLRTGGSITGPSIVSDISAYIAKPSFPVISVAASLDVGTKVAGITTGNTTLTVFNTGDANLSLTDVTLDDTTNFSVSPTTCTITPGFPNFCHLTVTFKPQVAGNPLTATLTLTHDALNGSTPVTLTGISLLPLELVGAASIPFNSGDAPKPLKVVDNIGQSIRICKSAVADFPSPSSFSVSGDVTLDPAAGCVLLPAAAAPRDINVSVTFLAPAGSGPKNAVLSFQRVVGGVDQVPVVSVQLQGNLGPVIFFDDTNPFNHGPNDQTEVDGSAFTERVINVSNVGNGPLNFTSFVITSVDPAQPGIAGEYTLAGTGCQGMATLAAGAAPCALTIRFDPAALGLRAANLTVTSDGKNLPQPQVIPLNGTGKHGPRLGVVDGALVLASNATVNLTSQRLGKVYPARVLTLSNGGTLGDLEVVLPAANVVPGFSVDPSGAGCSNLPPAATCTLSITFTPTALQHYGGAFDIQTRPAGGGGAFTVFRLNLAGDGTNSAPELSWRDASPQHSTVVTALTYGDVQAGNSLDRTVTLFNSGPGSVALGVVNIVGLDASNYSLDVGTCKPGQFIGEASGCDVTLRFAPITAGAKAVSLQAISDGNGPFGLPASGTGLAGVTAPVLAMAPAALAFDATRVGDQSAPLDLTLTNSGSMALTVQAFAVTGPYELQNKTCQTPPFVMTPASQCTVTVLFKPLAVGSVPGALNITTDASASPSVTPLSGNGASAADVSGGGCTTLGGDPRTDPMLWLLVLLAAGFLWQRKRARAIGPDPAGSSPQRDKRQA